MEIEFSMVPPLSKKQIVDFQKEILGWYLKHQRVLPWRKNREAYSILVSEIMLQQTQVSRVIPKFETWMSQFPTLKDLAESPTTDVLRHWSGLGYNRRALFLQRLAKEVMTCHGGKFPQTEKELRRLPGIGEYTARALLCFAFNEQVPVVDTNIKKVIAVHFFEGQVPEKITLEETVQLLLPKGKAYEWNQALMDYASAELREHKILIPKQSRFKDSDRYYRGQIVKMLTKEGAAHEEDMYAVFSIEKDRLAKILKGLEKDGFLIKQGSEFKVV